MSLNGTLVVGLLVACGACGRDDAAPLRAAPMTTDRDTVLERKVALTFDDLPGVAIGACTEARLRTVNQQLLAALARERVTVTALVTAGQDCSNRALGEIMAAWLERGHDLGNHSYSHFDLNDTPLEAYSADIERGAEPIAAALSAQGGRLRYFRHPFLHTGATPEAKRRLSEYLDSSGYVVAPVTIDNQEWVFAEAYVRALARGDSALSRKIVAGYVQHVEDSFAYYEALSMRIFGREIPQVLLLHVNRLNGDHFGRIAALIRERGYGVVSLAEALRDAAYESPDDYVGPRGLSWLQRWALTRGSAVEPEPREPAWLNAAGR